MHTKEKEVVRGLERYLVYRPRNKILMWLRFIIHTIYIVVHIFGMYDDLEYNSPGEPLKFYNKHKTNIYY